MPDREKVIKGLENCKEGGSCDGCQYNFQSSRCIFRLHEDALALLKEQEAVEPVLEQDFMVCGECGHDVILQRMIGDMLFDERVSYCPACGRSVKWE